jgi:hypothetical protein
MLAIFLKGKGNSILALELSSEGRQVRRRKPEEHEMR